MILFYIYFDFIFSDGTRFSRPKLQLTMVNDNGSRPLSPKSLAGFSTLGSTHPTKTETQEDELPERNKTLQDVSPLSILEKKRIEIARMKMKENLTKKQIVMNKVKCLFYFYFILSFSLF